MTEVCTFAAAGIIRTSRNPWSSPVIPMIFVCKKDPNVRLCVIFRQINSVTVPDPYLMPRVDKILGHPGKATYLTKMDLNKCFHEVPLCRYYFKKCFYFRHSEKFEYTHISFVLGNAPATFQRLIDVVLDAILDFSTAYIGDGIVFSHTWEDHVKHLRSVL